MIHGIHNDDIHMFRLQDIIFTQTILGSYNVTL